MRHILVVDDEAAICEILQMGLEHDGTCRVTCTATADDAMAAVQNDRPDAAIIDAVLQLGSGLVLAREVVALDVPVLVTSGEPGHQQRLRDAGCYFLPKPFSISQLLVETRRLLDEAADRKALLAAGLDRLLHPRRERTGLALGLSATQG